MLFYNIEFSFDFMKVVYHGSSKMKFPQKLLSFCVKIKNLSKIFSMSLKLYYVSIYFLSPILCKKTLNKENFSRNTLFALLFFFACLKGKLGNPCNRRQQKPYTTSYIVALQKCHWRRRRRRSSSIIL